jgi:hypothetical protein
MRASAAETKNAPSNTFTSTTPTNRQGDILGCGVERSRLPHCEHTSANRGFTCIRGHSFTLYVRPQNWQKSGSPPVTCPHS